MKQRSQKPNSRDIRDGVSHVRRSASAFWILAAVVAFVSTGCVTVRPEQRAILSDPKMRFQGDPRTAAELDHVLDNREGSFGGGSVEGGGCGCN
jgi:hypothetical protein